MILKKPYAFLIKHFKLIHIILAIPLIFITYKTRLVVKFFNQYVTNRYTFQTGSDVSGFYVSGMMLFSVLIIIMAALAIYFLLKYKEKPVKMYVFLIIYYITLFVTLFWLSNVISSMSRDILSAKAVRFYRDISTLIYYPQYIFIVFVALRAVGFNIKQFNFRSDLKELEITSADNEEVEVGFEIDGYKTKRFFRRFKREFGYYLVENKFMVTVVVIIVLFASIIVYYNTRSSYTSTYTQTDTFNHSGFSLKVTDSIISNLTYNGKVISDNNYYLAIKLNAINNSGKKKKLDYNSLVLKVGNKDIRPTLDKSTYFLDYAAPYYGENLNPRDEKDYVLVYKIDKKDINKTFKLKVLSSYEVKKDKLITNYAIVNLSPVIIDEIVNIKSTTLNDKISFSNSNVGNTLLTISNFYRGSSYVYETKSCKFENNCTTLKDIISVDYSLSRGDASLLVLDYDFDLDEETTYAKNIKKKSVFFENFVLVSAGNNESSITYDVVDVTPKGVEGKIILQVSGNILSTDKLDLFITIRNKRYIVKLV